MNKSSLLGALGIYLVTSCQLASAITIDLQAMPMTIGTRDLSFSFDGINASVSGYHVEYDATSSAVDKTTIYGPFSTSIFFTGGGSSYPSFGRVLDSGSGLPKTGLSLTSYENLGQTGDDWGSVGAPGFDNTDGGSPASSTLPSFQFALFVFDTPVDISQVIVDDVSNFNRDIWVAAGDTAPDLSGGFLDAFSGYTIINSSDDATDGFFTHSFASIQDISYLAIGAPPRDEIGNLGLVTSVNHSTQFYIQGLTINAVPIPAAAWLFGSGLFGLVCMASRKKAA
jgi:hypothetical protein